MVSYEYYIKTEKKHIDFINKILEAYEGLGVVRTLDPDEGRIKIITIDTYKEDIERIFIEMREKHGVAAEITSHGPWEGIL